MEDTRAQATSPAALAANLQALLDCLRAQQAAVARGDLAEARRQADRFDEIRAGLGPEALAAAGREPEGQGLLQSVIEEHQRLLTAVALLRQEVGRRLRQVRRGQPAVSAYGRQAAAVATRKGLDRADFGIAVRD